MTARKTGAPKARARKPAPSLRELAQRHASHALTRLVGLIDSKNERVALSATQTVLDRAHGKVTQGMNLKTPEGGLIVKIVRFKQEGKHAE